MKNKPLDMQVSFTCQDCQHRIEVNFTTEPVSVVSCAKCNKSFTVMRPTIAEEILIDWEKEALFQRLRAEKSQNSNSSLLALIIKVIELLTWRDKGNGQVEAIKEMRGWLIENEEVPPLAELIQSDANKRSSKLRGRKDND